MHALRSYLKLICEYELQSLQNEKVSGAKDHGKNYIEVRPPLVRHLLRNRLLKQNAKMLLDIPFSMYNVINNQLALNLIDICLHNTLKILCKPLLCVSKNLED